MHGNNGFGVAQNGGHPGVVLDYSNSVTKHITLTGFYFKGSMDMEYFMLRWWGGCKQGRRLKLYQLQCVAFL